MIRSQRDIYLIVLGIILAFTIPLVPAIINPSNWAYPPNTPYYVIIVSIIVGVGILVVVALLIRLVFRRILTIDKTIEDREEESRRELSESQQQIITVLKDIGTKLGVDMNGSNKSNPDKL